MIRCSFLIFVLLGCWAQKAPAGNRVGNGGDIVKCANGKSTLLDFYEVWRFEDGAKGSTLNGVLDLLQKVAPKLAEQYGKRAKTIREEMDFSNTVKPVEVSDSLHAFVPQDKDCKVMQLAIRIAEPPEGAKRFLVHKPLFDKLSPSAQDALIFHEIVYEHWARLDETDSRRVRKFVAHVFDPKFALESQGAFWVFMKNLKVPIYP